MADREVMLPAVAAVAGAVALLNAAILEEEALDKPKRIWRKDWLGCRDDGTQANTMFKLYQELLDDGETNHLMRTLRMPPAVFAELLEASRPSLTKKTTFWRKPIPAEDRLCITLRFLCLGDGFWSLHEQFRVGACTVALIIYDTCRAIYKVLQPLWMKVPNTARKWKSVANEFERRWNLPHIIGALDGKHVRIRKPVQSESLFRNYKNFFSIILMAIVDGNYNFLFVEVGAEGSACDAGVWDNCDMKKHIFSRRNALRLPKPSAVEGLEEPLPYYLVGDDAFPLSTSMMKPYPGLQLTPQERIFNYHLSRCRRIVENAFGILASKFAIYRQDLRMATARVEEIVIVLATCVLHNFLRAHCGKNYMGIKSVDHDGDHGELVNGTWREVADITKLKPLPGRNTYNAAKDMRKTLAEYCTGAGVVPWQYEMADVSME